MRVSLNGVGHGRYQSLNHLKALFHGFKSSHPHSLHSTWFSGQETSPVDIYFLIIAKTVPKYTSGIHPGYSRSSTLKLRKVTAKMETKL